MRGAPDDEWWWQWERPVPCEVDWEPATPLGTILGPDGTPLAEVYEARPPFGFAAAESETR